MKLLLFVVLVAIAPYCAVSRNVSTSSVSTHNNHSSIDSSAPSNSSAASLSLKCATDDPREHFHARTALIIQFCLGGAGGGRFYYRHTSSAILELCLFCSPSALTLLTLLFAACYDIRSIRRRRRDMGAAVRLPDTDSDEESEDEEVRLPNFGGGGDNSTQAEAASRQGTEMDLRSFGVPAAVVAEGADHNPKAKPKQKTKLGTCSEKLWCGLRIYWAAIYIFLTTWYIYDIWGVWTYNLLPEGPLSDICLVKL